MHNIFYSSFALVLFSVMACTGNSAKAKPNYVYKDAPKPGILAKVAGVELTEEDLVGDDQVTFLDLKKKEHAYKMDRLREVIKQKMIGAEAAKAKMSLDEYIEKKVVAGTLSVSTKEYDEFVKSKRIPEAQITPELKERINTFIKESKREEKIDAYVAKLTKSTPVEVHFKKPRSNVKVDIGKAPVLGDRNTPVTIVAFSDFQCPYCSKGALVMHEAKKKYGNKLSIAFKHFPLSFHAQAKPAAEASMCVHEQGGDAKFWKFHDVAFKNQEKLELSNLEDYAKQAGADIAKYKTCMESKKFAAYVEEDMRYGEKLKVRSTPMFFINGEVLAGALPIEAFSEVIDEAIADAKSSGK